MTGKPVPLWEDDGAQHIMHAMADVQNSERLLRYGLLCGTVLVELGAGAWMGVPYPPIWVAAGLVLVLAGFAARAYVRARLRRITAGRPMPEEVSTAVVHHNAGKLLVTLAINREASVSTDRLGAAYATVGQFVAERGASKEGQCHDHFHIAESD